MLVTAVDVVDEANDNAMLAPMMERAEETTGTKAQTTLADAGYFAGSHLEECASRGQQVVVSESRRRFLKDPYHKDQFTYDEQSDSFTCPQGQTLHFVRIQHANGVPLRLYRASGAVCQACPAFGVCTRAREIGRSLAVGPHDAVLRRHRAWMATSAAKEAYRLSGPSVQVDFTLKPAWDLEQLKPNSFFPIPASVVFARKLSQDVSGKPLAGSVERWRGTAGAEDARRETAGITDTGAAGESPYGGYSRQGATIVPRVLFFVNETANTAIVQAAPTVTVNPRRGSQDKVPWKDLDLTAITGQTVENRHVFDVHLGETIVPYVALEPLKALLPLKRGDAAIPADDNGPGGIRLGGLERRMRERWQTVSRLWEGNKALANNLTLLQRLDYVHNLQAQLEWQRDAGNGLLRVVYTKSGEPTAALLQDSEALIDHLLYWIPCSTIDEANYLLAIINSDALQAAVKPLMSKGQFGPRDLHKHLWKLPIPEFAPTQELHVTIAKAGGTTATRAKAELDELQEQRGDKLTVTIARRELRKWLRGSTEGKAVETFVGREGLGARPRNTVGECLGV